MKAVVEILWNGSGPQVTNALRACSDGDQSTSKRLTPLVDELRSLAQRYMRGRVLLQTADEQSG